MAREMMMVPTDDYSNLVNYYKGRLTESALLNKASRLAAERHVTLKNSRLPTSVALAMTKPKAGEIQRLTRRLRSSGASTASSRSNAGAGDVDAEDGDDDDGDDDLLKTPLDSKLDKILRATKKRNRPGPQATVKTPTRKIKRKRPTPQRVTFSPPPSKRLVPSTPKRPRKQQPSSEGGWIKAAGRGALKSVAKRWGVSVPGSGSTQRGAATASGGARRKKKVTPRAVKALRPAPGWEDFTEGHKARRVLLPKYDDSDTTASYDDYEKEEGQEHAWIPSFSTSKKERTY